MRKITAQAIAAFNAGKPFNKDNTSVELSPLGGVVVLKLHGNAIARRDIEGGHLEVTNASWYSNTTKERLNGLNGVSIYQKKGVWHLNGYVWANPEVFTLVSTFKG
jgi:hypothetical protein